MDLSSLAWIVGIFGVVLLAFAIAILVVCVETRDKSNALNEVLFSVTGEGGRDIREGSVISFLDGAWRVHAIPQPIANTSFPPDFTASITPSTPFDMNFDVEEKLTGAQVHLDAEVHSLTAATLRFHVQEVGGSTWLDITRNVPAMSPTSIPLDIRVSTDVAPFVVGRAFEATLSTTTAGANISLHSVHISS